MPIIVESLVAREWIDGKPVKLLVCSRLGFTLDRPSEF